MYPLAVEPAPGRLAGADLLSAPGASGPGGVRAGNIVHRRPIGSGPAWDHGRAWVSGRAGRKAEAAGAVLAQVHRPYPLTDPHRTSRPLMQPRLRSAGC